MTVYTAWYRDGPTQIKVKAQDWQVLKESSTAKVRLSAAAEALA